MPCRRQRRQRRSKPKPKPTPQPPKSAEAGPPPSSDAAVEAAAATDPGEEAYSNGFHLWEAGNYDEAISALRSFVSAYPKHKRVSYANNLIGRALLDKGDAQAQPRRSSPTIAITPPASARRTASSISARR